MPGWYYGAGLTAHLWAQYEASIDVMRLAVSDSGPTTQAVLFLTHRWSR
jgi:hypothetical protein